MIATQPLAPDGTARRWKGNRVKGNSVLLSESLVAPLTRSGTLLLTSEL